MSENEILLMCRQFVRDQSEGEWDDRTINSDAEHMKDMIVEIIAQHVKDPAA